MIFTSKVYTELVFLRYHTGIEKNTKSYCYWNILSIIIKRDFFKFVKIMRSTHGISSWLCWNVDYFFSCVSISFVYGLRLLPFWPGRPQQFSWYITWTLKMWYQNQQGKSRTMCRFHKLYSICLQPVDTLTISPIYQHGLTLILAWISNHMPSEVWDEITDPFLNFNGARMDK